jgi:hypothetical protein
VRPDQLLEEIEIASKVENARHARREDHVIDRLFFARALDVAAGLGQKVVISPDVGEETRVETRTRISRPA